jgi:transcriptional regulator with XRE-family HTH domain
LGRTIFTGGHAKVVQAIIQARKAAGLTQRELADRLNKSQSFVALIETSQRRIDIVEFIAIALTSTPERLLKASMPDGAARDWWISQI